MWTYIGPDGTGKIKTSSFKHDIYLMVFYVVVTQKVWVVVIDGITVGHPCCAVHNCHIPLANNQHRFCPLPTPTHGFICAIIRCNNKVTVDSRVCSDLMHKQVEKIHKEQGKSQFQLQEWLQHARVAHPNDFIGDEIGTGSIKEAEEGFKVDEHGIVLTAAATEAHRNTPVKRIQAQFVQKHTHNEQIIVAPCGMIIACETFYGAEGVGSVVVCKAYLW